MPMWGAVPLHSRFLFALVAVAALLWGVPAAVAADPPATITAVSPMSGAVGSTVTITGSNFVNVSSVTFYDYPSPSFTVVSPTQITAVVPAGTPSPGRWRVVTAAGTAVYDPLFTVTGTPTITGVSPMSGPVGSTVTISGSNFVNVTKVSFYDYPSPSFTVVSPTQITAIVPAGTPSPGRWRVINPAYSAVYNPLFTVTGTPAITGVSPMSGPVGSTVTISGSNFVNVTKVSFYDYPSPSFTVVSPTQITAIVPAGTPSPGRWRVVNPAYSAVYDPLFTVTTASPPTNTSLPTITGTPQVGQLLTASNGNWSSTTPITYTYQWQSCDSAGNTCTPITNATTNTYTPTTNDQTHTLRIRVTATNNTGPTTATSTQTTAVQAGGSSGLHVSGNQLLGASGSLVRLHGVNKSGTEYACIQGWGIFDGPSDAASVTAIKSWNSNIVHIGLNEDCILGINGVQAAYAGSNYMNAIVAYVNRLHAQGLFAEVSLMWAAPGTQQALDHPPILNQDHSPAALKAIANAFKTDPNTIIGLQSEPHAISWACWKNGGSSCSVGYTALGMQAALDAVRSTGATNVVTASGIDYANNLSQWLANKPSDPLNQLMAEAHVYGGNTCSNTSCFNADYAPVAATVPLLFGETGETYDASSCAATNINTFITWADNHNTGYEAWTWNTWGNCSSLISNDTGTPANTYATWIKNHYTSLP